MKTINIENIWNKINAHAGEEFSQIRGQKFTYEVSGNILTPSTTNRNLPKSQFEKAIELLPLDGTKEIQHLQGPIIYICYIDG